MLCVFNVFGWTEEDANTGKEEAEGLGREEKGKDTFIKQLFSVQHCAKFLLIQHSFNTIIISSRSSEDFSEIS